MKKPTQRLTRIVISDPVHFFAFGFGVGLIKFAPGTFGSILGVILFWLTIDFGIYIQLGITVIASLAGVWICGESARRIGLHDHKGIVWDEIVGMYLTLLAATFSIFGWVVAFICFRLIDILKPWPINLIDKKIKGGIGIMLDDLVAALYSIIMLISIKVIFNV
tara:strand:+ start:2812 stop:3303 length:492 start_codon:yes stop_codon:yes gene_type:complete